MNLGDALLAWYRKEGRELPWRQNITPYKVWLSEIIMQQTRVAQGLPYYEKFLKELPSVETFANAEQDKILNLWQGLGYYSRARNMHFAANQVMNDFGGKFPSNFEDLRKLKGVGDYTAAAIASIAFGEKKAVVDGNVYRVLSRLFNVELPIDKGKGKKYFQELADELIHPDSPGDYNQAIMDFGAMVCTPKSPLCGQCPLQQNCLGLEKDRVFELPVKSKKVKVRDRYLEYFEFICDDEIAIEQRGSKDIWEGLFQLPLVEVQSKKEQGINAVLNLIDRDDLEVEKRYETKHILSHQRLHTNFYRVALTSREMIKGEFIWVKKRHLSDYAFPKLISNYLYD